MSRQAPSGNSQDDVHVISDYLAITEGLRHRSHGDTQESVSHRKLGRRLNFQSVAVVWYNYLSAAPGPLRISSRKLGIRA